jgi:hypothetical protein
VGGSCDDVFRASRSSGNQTTQNIQKVVFEKLQKVFFEKLQKVMFEERNSEEVEAALCTRGKRHFSRSSPRFARVGQWSLWVHDFCRVLEWR